MKVPILKSKARMLGESADPLAIWGLLFSDNIFEHIMQCTNKKLNSMSEKYSAVSKHHLFATDGTGRDIFRAVLSKKRFAVLLAAIRFDNREDREERKKDDPTAAISFVFNSFIENCQSLYGLGQSATVDEMLVSFRGRCRFKM